MDALLHMNRYDLGVIPDELQRPLVDDSSGPAAVTAYDYAERLPPTDPHWRTYAQFVASHHAALMPTFSLYFLELPGHRNLWKEEAAKLLDPAHMFEPSDRPQAKSFIRFPPGRVTRPNPRSVGWKTASARRLISLRCGCGE